MTAPRPASASTYIGLFVVCLATLMYEILLTRIFSATTWHHFAFMSVSIVMFGLSLGSVLIFLKPARFRPERTDFHLCACALGFSVTLILSFLVHLWVPFAESASVTGFLSVVVTYSALAVPFTFVGVCIGLALTRFPDQVGKLYAADLAGAACGCLLLVLTLEYVDGPTATLAIGALAALGAVAFAARISNPGLRGACYAAFLLLTALFLIQADLAREGRPFLRLVRVKGKIEDRPLYEKWNSFSRVTVSGDPKLAFEPTGWGLSRNLPQMDPIPQLGMKIDGMAGTTITAFSGDFSKVEYLKYDITNLAHYLRPDSEVFVIGAGGGRDILSALAFDQKSVTAVEINPNIFEAANDRFGDFSGNLDRDPRVRLVVDEARSYLARESKKYDLIQASLIDTWAATAAGAFAMAENTLYTVEAWETFLHRLTDRGVLSFSRWYLPDLPAEIHRCVALARAALERLGIESPMEHILIAGMLLEKFDYPDPVGVGTILVSRSPFSESDRAELAEVCAKMDFQVLLGSDAASDETLRTLVEADDLSEFYRDYPLNITPVEDDRPFFFNMMRARSLWDRELWKTSVVRFNLRAFFVLAALMATVVLLTYLCLIAPFFFRDKGISLRGSAPFFLYFAGIGLGFMLVEISQLQRLIVFLGHPTYGLTVVLFSLLLSSGLGSLFIGWRRFHSEVFPIAAYVCLLAVLTVFGIWTPALVREFETLATAHRILLAVASLFPMGFLMGMAFPFGMRLAARRFEAVTTWFWAVNGATSVCASVLAAILSLAYGISITFWAGSACYLLALFSYLWASRTAKDGVPECSGS